MIDGSGKGERREGEVEALIDGQSQRRLERRPQWPLGGGYHANQPVSSYLPFPDAIVCALLRVSVACSQRLLGIVVFLLSANLQTY